MHSYKAYSLNILSEIEFPELLESNEESNDIKIVIGTTPDALKGDQVVKKVRYSATENEVLYKLKGAGKIYITNGSTITVEPEANPDWQHLKNHIRGRAIAAILHQRGLSILHGSAICHNDEAIIFIGKSGGGKSTFLAAFIEKGYDFISDDLCLLKKQPNGTIKIAPAYPQIRLWTSSIDLIGSSDNLTKGAELRSGLDKYFYVPDTKFNQQPVSVRSIYVLNASQVSDFSIEELDSVTKLNLLLQHSYAKGHREGLGGHAEQFKVYSKLLNTTKVKVVQRPFDIDRNSFSRMINQVESDFLGSTE